MSQKLKIAICGGGPAGLILARLLQVHRDKVECTIFERDSRCGIGQQGGSLDLHPESGQLALRQAGLFDQFTERARYEGQALRITDAHGALIFDTSVSSRPTEIQDRPEIDRTSLQDMLLDSVDPQTLRWNSKILGTAQSIDGKYEVRLEDHIEVGFDVVVGADGAWSKIRPMLSKTVPHYAGINGVHLEIENLQTQHPHLAKLIGPGTFYGLGEGKSIAGQYCGRGVAQVYVWLLADENWRERCGVDWTNAEIAKHQLLQRCFSSWDRDLQSLLLASKNNIVPRPIYSLPEDHRWVSSDCVTLIGDAAHLMPPFSGIGVNLAMLDAYELSQDIISACQRAEGPTKINVREGLDQFEKRMFARSKKHAQETAKNQKMLYSDNVGEMLRKKMLGDMKADD